MSTGLSDRSRNALSVACGDPTVGTELQTQLANLAPTVFNKVTVTAPTTGATLTLADGSTLATVGAYAVTLTATATTALTLPTTGTLATLAGSETLSNKTLTDPIVTNVTRCSGSVTANGTVTLANVTGLVQTVAVGTYKFRCVLPSTVASGTGGIKYAFKLTTTVLTSIEATALGFTASAVAVQHTTTGTDQATLFTQAAVVILTIIEGTMVVGTGGTIQLQMCQDTSNGSNSITLVGASMEFTRIS